MFNFDREIKALELLKRVMLWILYCLVMIYINIENYKDNGWGIIAIIVLTSSIIGTMLIIATGFILNSKRCNENHQTQDE